MTVDPVAFIQAETKIGTAPLVPELRLHLADAALPLWQATETVLAERDLPPPYWAFAWPGGQALARLLLDEPERARGRVVLDIGAGGGIAALAAAKAGAARVIAADIDRFAHAAMALNAALNGLALEPAGDVLAEDDPWLAQADLILIGDMCYEKPLADRIKTTMRAAAARGVEVLLADPGRAYKPTDGLIEIARHVVPTSLDLEDRTSRETVVWRVAG